MPGPKASRRLTGRVLIGIAILAALMASASLSTRATTQGEPASAILAWAAPLQFQSFTFDSIR